MTIDEFIDKFTKFITESDSFHGFVMSGLYTIPNNCFIDALHNFLISSENVLDEFSKMEDLFWDDNILPRDKIEFANECLDNKNYWNIYHFHDNNQINELKKRISESINYFEYLDSAEYKRQQANIFTANQKTRKAIFNRDGKICKKCKAVKNLTLDHIIPVSKGGKNSLENLQVLCKSCNSKKSNKL
jgi:5-methylcytosine-specific restriction endonuclease McrA